MNVTSHVVRMSDPGRDWLAALEGGYRLKAYLCPANVWTISAGVTRYPGGARVKMGDVIATDDEARRLFAAMLVQYEDGVDALTRDDLTQHEFDALVSFSFNVGIEGYKTSTLARFVNLHVAAAEIERQFLRWKWADTDPHHPGLEESPGLLLRRECEAQVFVSGVYETTGDLLARRKRMMEDRT